MQFSVHCTYFRFMTVIRICSIRTANYTALKMTFFLFSVFLLNFDKGINFGYTLEPPLLPSKHKQCFETYMVATR